MDVMVLVVVVSLVELGLHYFPWRMLLGCELPRLASYTLGMLGVMLPISAELAIIQRMVPVHRLRIQQASDRTGLTSLLDPALDETADFDAGMAAIGEHVRAALGMLLGS